MTAPDPATDVAWTTDDDPDAWAEFRSDVDRREPVMYDPNAPRWEWLIGKAS